MLDQKSKDDKTSGNKSKAKTHNLSDYIKSKSNDFEQQLTNFIEKMVPRGVDVLGKYGDIRLSDFDFDVDVAPVLVASIPGRHKLLDKDQS